MRNLRHCRRTHRRLIAWAVFPILACAVLAACATVVGSGTSVAVRTGAISQQDAQRARQVAETVDPTLDFTPEQEYYIGRAVAAQILARYEAYDDPAANAYLNLIGQTLALASTRPEIYDGYRFMILDSDEVNAFATPSGLVMVTRGALGLTQTEDCVAAILAHEIGHIEARHGLRAIQSSRFTGRVASLVGERVQQHTPEELRQLTEAFEGSIGDVTEAVMNTGYSRPAELEADEAAVRILRAVGYHPGAVVTVLRALEEQSGPGSTGLARTHPRPHERITNAQRAIGTYRATPPPPARQERYDAALGSI